VIDVSNSSEDSRSGTPGSSSLRQALTDITPADTADNMMTNPHANHNCLLMVLYVGLMLVDYCQFAIDKKCYLWK